MMERVLTDPNLPRRMTVMRRSFAELEHRRPGLAFLQSQLAAR
jgi:hypothetical protein